LNEREGGYRERREAQREKKGAGDAKTEKEKFEAAVDETGRKEKRQKRMYVCVCVRERKRKRERIYTSDRYPDVFINRNSI